jgi:hypothetical protein
MARITKGKKGRAAMSMRKSKIKSCVVLNPPATPEEQAAFDRRVAKALALGLYRTLGPERVDAILRQVEGKEDKKETA